MGAKLCAAPRRELFDVVVKLSKNDERHLKLTTEVPLAWVSLCGLLLFLMQVETPQSLVIEAGYVVGLAV